MRSTKQLRPLQRHWQRLGVVQRLVRPAILQKLARQKPEGPSHDICKVMRGGSFLCHDSYCFRYRVGARSNNEPDASTSNLGFRIIAKSRKIKT